MRRIGEKSVQSFEREHIERLRGLAPECMVLLESNGDFPLREAGKLALFGSGARQTIKGGTGSGDVNVREYATIEQGLENAGFEITTGEWLAQYDRVREEAHKQFIEKIKAEAKKKGVPAIFYGMGAVMPEPEYDIPLEGGGEAAVYVLARTSGEGADRGMVPGDFCLTETEKRDILRLSEQYPRFLLVLNTGGVVDLSGIAGKVKNILLLSQLGMVTGDVFADVLLGKSYPSGKLAATWAGAGQYCAVGTFGDEDDTFYREGIYVGYRYFDTVGEKPLYPFGYGLGYTEFSIQCDGTPFLQGAEICLKVKVKNTGRSAGKEVVQLYCSAPEGKLDKAFQELAAFGKTRELLPGEEDELTISFAVGSMAAYDTERAAYLLEKGEYRLFVGNSSRDTKECGSFLVEEDIITEKWSNIGGDCGFEDWKPQNRAGREESVRAASGESARGEAIRIGKEFFAALSREQKSESAAASPDTLKWKKTLEQCPKEELALLCVGKHRSGNDGQSFVGAAGNLVAGAAGETYGGLSDRGINGLVMADGPAGLRLAKEYLVEDGGCKPVQDALPATFLELIDEEAMAAMGFGAPQEEDGGAAPEVSAAEREHYYQYCSAIPIGTALAQSWNMALCEECGDLIGEEMELFGIHLWLAPALNIQRSPLCGRNFEYYSEDPLISGKTAAALTRGVQSHKGCGVTIKHFACNNQETNRFHSNSVVSERALREIYLKGFEICVREAQPTTVMSSYNLLNGVHTCNRRDLMTDVLRGEWGFQGFVMTDWSVTGGFGASDKKYPAASSAGCVQAGNDVIMPGGVADVNGILRSVAGEDEEYRVSEEQLRECAARVAAVAEKLG